MAAGGSLGRTILVVDDDATFRASRSRILEKRGYRVLAVDDGDQAAGILADREQQIDLLLTDVVLPGQLQGRAGCTAGPSLRPGLPVLYMSAYARDTIVQAGRLEVRRGLTWKSRSPRKHCVCGDPAVRAR